MESKFDLEIASEDYVPTGAERVAWLEQHGPQPAKVVVTCVAPLASWQAAGFELRTDGSVAVVDGGNRWAENASKRARSALAVACAWALAVDPATRQIDASIVLAGAVRAERERDREAKRAAEAAATYAAIAAEHAATVAARAAATAALIPRLVDGTLPVIHADGEPIRYSNEWGDVDVDAVYDDPRVVAARERAIAAHAAKLAADKGGIAKLVREHGDASQIERWEADVLPEEEVLELARAAWLAPIDVPLYELLTALDVEHNEACVDSCDPGNDDVSFSSKPCPGGPWTAGQWARLRAVERAYEGIEGATVTPMEHEARCTTRCLSCTATTYRYGARVTVTRHGVTIKAEYGLGE